MTISAEELQEHFDKGVKFRGVSGQCVSDRCKYCDVCFTYERKRGLIRPATCGSVYCKREYERLRKQKLRGTDLITWQQDSHKRRTCCVCNNRRLVDSDGVCKKCYKLKKLDT